jgi:hypothetical protein
MNVPDPRPLPAGQHLLRREHLLQEIRRSVRPRVVSRRVLRGAGAIVLAGSGLAAAASAGVLPGTGGRPTSTVVCYSRAATQHVSATIIHPPDPDPVHACQMVWGHRMLIPPPRNRPAKANGPSAVPPNLVACALKAKNGQPAPVGVFPGPPETCQRLGLLPLTSTTSPAG